MVVENSFPRLFRTVLADSSQSEDHSLQTVASTSKDENTEAKKEPVVLDPKELSVHLTPEQALLKNTAKHNPLIQGSIPKETAIATHAALIKGLSPEREKRIRELYDRLDMDNDGTVDIRDLTAALRREMPHIPERLAPKLMARLSGSKDDDKVNFHDFVKYVVEHEQRLETIFQDLDRNRDGYIDVREIKSYCDNLGAPITDTRARDIVEKMDQTGSASINLNEFQEFMLLYPSSDVKDMVDFWRHNLMNLNGSSRLFHWAVLTVLYSRPVGPFMPVGLEQLFTQDVKNFLMCQRHKRKKLLAENPLEIIDIGEDSQLPEDFTKREIETGVWWRHLVAGGVAGCMSRTCTAPFDRIKVYMQVHSTKTNKLGVMSCVHLLHAEGGIRSFWRGNGINVIKIAPESALKFMAYEQCKRLIQQYKGDTELTVIERFSAGSAAGAISQTAIYPMEVMKTRLALRRTGQLDRGILHFVYKMYKKEGIISFYKGYVPNLLGIIPYAGIDLAVYETLKKWYIRRHPETEDPGVLALLACGTVSSTCGQLTSYPLALVRTRLQARAIALDNSGIPDTMIGQFRHILKHDGPLGLYRGIAPNFLKVIPAVSISYVVYENVRKRLGATMS